ncbi:MAG: GNAT family N-acetyltransferase [Acidobacteriota bacterium]
MIGLLRRGEGRTEALKVGRLRLVTITPEMLAAEQIRDLKFVELQRLLGARTTEEWPPEHWEPHVYDFILKQYEEHPETLGWHRYVLLADESGDGATLIGALGAFPKADEDVEIGYSTLPAFQRRGYATAAAKVLVEYLLRSKGVRSVSAQTFLRLPESVKVMERCGMTLVGEGDEPESVRYRRMR